jgi:hypothetical protein
MLHFEKEREREKLEIGGCCFCSCSFPINSLNSFFVFFKFYNIGNKKKGERIKFDKRKQKQTLFFSWIEIIKIRYEMGPKAQYF